MAQAPVYYCVVGSPVGDLLLTSDGGSLHGLYLESHRRGPVPSPDWRRDESPFRAAAEQLSAYFAGDRPGFDLPVALRGTEFQRRVWASLRAVPFGTTVSYAELARRIGSPKAVRAVGSAVGRNPVSILVPCHRVVGTDGGLTGYAGGLDRKRWLLHHEAPAGSVRGF